MNTGTRGAFPTMITPYKKDGSVDWNAVAAMTEWYWRKGCQAVADPAMPPVCAGWMC